MRNALIGGLALILVVEVGCSSGSDNGSPGTAGASGGSGNTAGSGGGAGGSVTTIAGSKALKDLSSTETAQLCNDTSTYFGSGISGADRCKWVGLVGAASSSPQSDAMMVTDCTHFEDGCKNRDGGAQAGSDCFGAIDPSCAATVAQYASCIADIRVAFNTTVQGLPACTAAKVSDIPRINTAGGGTPATCTPLAACGLSAPDPSTF